MFHFEAEDIQLDMIELLSNFGIPVAVYQRLELVFRQVMMKSPAIQSEYRHYEPHLDLEATPLIENIDQALDDWHLRYPDQTYGLSPIICEVAEGRAKARALYRKALTSFNELSDVDALTDRWLIELNSKLRFHVSRNKDVEANTTEDLAFYLAAAEIVFRPFFEMHFQNRRHTSENLHEFLAIKMTLEAGHPIDISAFSDASILLPTAVRDIERYIHLPEGWVATLVDGPFRYASAA